MPCICHAKKLSWDSSFPILPKFEHVCNISRGLFCKKDMRAGIFPAVLSCHIPDHENRVPRFVFVRFGFSWPKAMSFRPSVSAYCRNAAMIFLVALR